MLDRRDLAEALTKLVETYLNGDDVDINNYSQYDKWCEESLERLPVMEKLNR